MSNIDIIRQHITTKLNQRTELQKEQYQRRQAKHQHFYNTPIWKHLRNYKIGQNPVCECCLKWKGLVVPATEVHHAIPYQTALEEADKWTLFTDYSNLVSLCSDCHDKVHALMRKEHKVIDARYTDIFSDTLKS